MELPQHWSTCLDKKIYYYWPPKKKGFDGHHIVPRHRGGTDADGVVYLTKMEHANEHWKLFLEHGDPADGRAVNLIMERKVISTAFMSGENNPFYGKKHKPETIKKISETKKKQFANGEVMHPSTYTKHGKEHQSYSHGKLVNARNDPEVRKAYKKERYERLKEEGVIVLKGPNYEHMKGENNPGWKGGISKQKGYKKEYDRKRRLRLKNDI